MEWSSVDFPEPFSPVTMTSGCERSTTIGMWKFRFAKTGCARIFRNIDTSGYQSGSDEQSVRIRIAPHELAVQLRGILTVALRKNLFAERRADFRTEDSFVAEARECIRIEH